MTALILLSAGVVFPGCGSKVSEANYYKVAEGATVAQVEKLLGPGRVSAVEASPDGSQRTIRRWEYGNLRITVVFERGKVVARKGEGLSTGDESFSWPEAATQPTVTTERD